MALYISASWPVVAAVLLVSYVFWQAVYRLYWSPLAKFPGPRLAALTFAYEFYFDVWMPGMFVWEIKRLHQVYGIYSFFPRISSLWCCSH